MANNTPGTPAGKQTGEKMRFFKSNTQLVVVATARRIEDRMRCGRGPILPRRMPGPLRMHLRHRSPFRRRFRLR